MCMSKNKSLLVLTAPTQEMLFPTLPAWFRLRNQWNYLSSNHGNETPNTANWSLYLFLIILWFQVDDQMKLLQHSWSDMLVLDHIHQRMHNNLPDETTLHNGQKFDLLNLGLLGVPV
ncbi:hypothetical protein NQ317_004446 [Molorchus minor]|uniref:Uncharacterized protein n=1 Tax=Molorchus minor TaxID=1323400 RepID=A0ABQ9IYB2_9CUCU|nr:hypothetical protein NQ317_004446 [Molorchus minor]